MAIRKKKDEPQPQMQSFVFEIAKWQSSYGLSVNRDKHREGPYWEHLTLEIEGACVFPAALQRRSVLFSIVSERDCIGPEILQQEPDWRPRGVGLLDLGRGRSGSFYASVPQDSFLALTTGFAHELFRYVDLFGAPLKRGKSLCSGFRLIQSVDLREY